MWNTNRPKRLYFTIFFNLIFPYFPIFSLNCVCCHLFPAKDLYSRKDMNLARFNIDCIDVAWREQVELPIVQFVDDARALINGGNF